MAPLIRWLTESSLLLLSFLLSLLLSLAEVLIVDAELAELSEDLDGSVLLGNLERSLSELCSWSLKDVPASVLSGGGLELVSGRISNVTLLGLVSSSWEEDQLALVAFKSLHVQLKSLLISVVSSMVNSDADGSGEGRADLGLGELLERETSSVSDLR